MPKVTEEGAKTKRLTVEMDFRTPQFKFEGEWTGRDIITTMTQMRRAYLRHQKGVRKQSVTVEENQETTK